MDMNNMITIDTIKCHYIYKNLFNFNKDIFICYGNFCLSLFKRLNDSKIYKLLSNIKLENIQDIIKIKNKILLAYDDYGIYEINIQTCKIKKISIYIIKHKKIEFIVKINNIIYLYQKEALYLLKYLKDELMIISCYKFDEKDVIKNLLNKINPRIIFNINIKYTKFTDEEMIKIYKMFNKTKSIIESFDFNNYYKFLFQLKMMAIEKEKNGKNEKKRIKEINNCSKNIIHNMNKNIKKNNYLNNNKYFKKKYR